MSSRRVGMRKRNLWRRGDEKYDDGGMGDINKWEEGKW